MSLIEWSDDLTVGIAEVDRDHQELVAIVNELHEVVSSGANGRSAADLLLRLARQARDHFVREEAMMVGHGYPAAAEHAREHAELMNVFSFMLDGVRTGKVTLDTAALEHVRRWLCGHIENSDSAMARFTLKRMTG